MKTFRRPRKMQDPDGLRYNRPVARLLPEMLRVRATIRPRVFRTTINENLEFDVFRREVSAQVRCDRWMLCEEMPKRRGAALLHSADDGVDLGPRRRARRADRPLVRN